VTVRTSTQVPYALQEAIVQACGSVFWYKRPLKALLVRAGVPIQLVEKHSDASKFILTREVLAELDARGEAGVRVQHQLVLELAAMRTVADPDNQEAGLKALADLRAVAKQCGVLEQDRPHDGDARSRRKSAEHKLEAVAARAKGLGELHTRYMELALQPDGEQGRGYDLQDLLEALFKLHDISYRPPYRKGTVEETDGFFTFRSFGYLVEARWRKERPPIGELRAFSGKVKAKIESTRGLFFSVPGFRDEVVGEAAALSNLILMDGQELAVILEGRISLVEGLQLKLDKAAQQGLLYYSLASHA
jgi:hypothetical protein